MERSEVQQEVESSEVVVSRKAETETGTMGEESQVLKESMVDSSAEGWCLQL